MQNIPRFINLPIIVYNNHRHISNYTASTVLGFYSYYSCSHFTYYELVVDLHSIPLGN